MAKKISLITVVIICAISIGFGWYYSRGHITKAESDYGNPQLYTVDEVETAGDLIMDDFAACGGFKGCDLLHLSYDEELSKALCEEYDSDIIAFSVYFKTGIIWNDNDFNANSYEECAYYLKRKDANSEWTVGTKGVG